MNIYDISKRAGVSIATVSRVLNNSPHVSQATRDRVMKVIEDSGYVPNAFARGLGLNSMQTIGLLCPNASDPYLAQALAFLERALRSKGYDCLLTCTGKGPAARSVRLDLPHFTLIGATTRLGAIAAPLRDRFGVQCRLEFYKPEELQFIITRAADILGVKIDSEGANEIARRSRGTPRIANRLLKRVRDFAQVLGVETITRQLADEALAKLEVDRYGLDRNDRRILNTIVKTFGGGPVGIETIAAAVSEESGTIEDVIEPYLIQLGMLQRTPRGRRATREAYRYLGVPMPEK